MLASKFGSGFAQLKHKPARAVKAMPTGQALSKDEMRRYRAGKKYTTVNGKWVIDTSRDVGVRPIDLVSRDPDRLHEHETREAALASYLADSHGRVRQKSTCARVL